MASDSDAGPGGPRSPDDSGARQAPPSAWRLTFEYEGDDVRLVGRQQVSMVAPPDDAELLERGKAGYWIEVRDAEGSSLYSQVLHDPIRTDYEVFSPVPGEIPTRVAAPEVKGVFQTVVPDLPGGTDIVLHGRAGHVELAQRSAKQLLKTRLRERPTKGGPK